MGFEDREYLRDEQRRYEGAGGGWSGGGFRAGGSGQWAIKFLVIANIVVFLVQGTTAQISREEFQGGATDLLALNLASIQNFELWRFVTYGFCHSANILHIVFNMIGLWIFGRLVEPILGSKEFLCFYLTGIVAAGVAHIISQALTGSPAGTIGASGGVFAVAVLAARHFPHTPFLFMFVIPLQLQYLVLIYIGFDLLGTLDPADHVARFAHLGGAAFGLLYFQLQWRITGITDALSGPWKRHKLKQTLRQRGQELQVFDPGDDDLREEVDRILAKIHTQGESQLTDKERETLKRASRIFRGR